MTGYLRGQFTDKQVANAVAASSTYAEAARMLGIPNKAEAVRYWAKKLEVELLDVSTLDWQRVTPVERSKGSELIDKMAGSFREARQFHEDNSCILIIPDMHIPYHHVDTVPFLKAVAEKYKPTRVICLGDEVDNHGLSYHEHDPELPNAKTEVVHARSVIKEMEELFPKLDLLESNHGSLLFRKAKTFGIPREMLKSYNQIYNVGEGWQWYDSLTIDLPNGQGLHLHHGRGANPLKVSQMLGMSYIAGHYHTQCSIQYWSNPRELNWAMQAGCLIDSKSLAFAYNKLEAARPIIGCALVIDSLPVLIPMVWDKHKRWVGTL